MKPIISVIPDVVNKIYGSLIIVKYKGEILATKFIPEPAINLTNAIQEWTKYPESFKFGKGTKSYTEDLKVYPVKNYLKNGREASSPVDKV